LKKNIEPKFAAHPGAKPPINAEPAAQPEPEKPGFADVREFSTKSIRVMILKPQGTHLWHHNYECLANFDIPRNAKIDEIFKVTALEKLYRQTIKGVGHGDSEETVNKTLGAPDATHSYQPFGFFKKIYFKDDVIILFQDHRVKTITRGVSPELKKEIEGNGPHIGQAHLPPEAPE